MTFLLKIWVDFIKEAFVTLFIYISVWFFPRKLILNFKSPDKIFNSSEISNNFKMSDTDGGKSGSDFDDETYGSKKRKTKQKVNYIFNFQWQYVLLSFNLTPMQQVWTLYDLTLRCLNDDRSVIDNLHLLAF